ELRDGRAGPRADETLRRIDRRHHARGVAGVGVRAGVRVADREIEDNGARDVRDLPFAHGHPDAVLLEEPHDAGVGREAERAAAGQADRIGPMSDGESGRQRHGRAESATILPMATRSEWDIQKSEASSSGAMITAEHPLAAEAGARILREGGNAVDAAVAAAF